jgi:hypothetical protein
MEPTASDINHNADDVSGTEPDGRYRNNILLNLDRYNSIVYSSLNANAYPVVVAPLDFVSNSSISTSFYEEQTRWPDDALTWSIADLRSGIMDGSFEYLGKDECINAFADSFRSDRRTVVLVTHEPMTGSGISLAGYGYAGGIEAANPAKTVLSQFGYLGALDFIFERFEGMKGMTNLDPTGYEWMCYVHSTGSGASCSRGILQGWDTWNVTARDWTRYTEVCIPE